MKIEINDYFIFRNNIIIFKDINILNTKIRDIKIQDIKI